MTRADLDTLAYLHDAARAAESDEHWHGVTEDEPDTPDPRDLYSDWVDDERERRRREADWGALALGGAR